MTYFELFNIPVALKLNPATLSKTYFELSRQYHPDYHVNLTDDEQAEALEKSALLNKAWQTFRDPDALIKYVLQIKGLLQEEEKYSLPPDFLMEMMELNEALLDPDHPDPVSLKAQIDQMQNEIYEPVQEIVEHYQEGVTTQEALLRVKEYYYKKKYLDRTQATKES